LARKNLLKNVISSLGEERNIHPQNSYALKGASAKMKVTLESLAENAQKVMDGENIVDIDPEKIDASFIKDRLAGDEEAFQALKQSMQERGQDTPILLRVHPENPQRYMVVFGHRRLRAADQLGRPVRAVIKQLDDIEHVLSQGQENAARADLSFIEKALFARNLLEKNYPKQVIQSALSIDATLLSRMLSISQKIPQAIIEAIGPAPAVGRDRWELCKRQFIAYRHKNKLLDHLTQDKFKAMGSNERFDFVLDLTAKKTSRSKEKKIKSQSYKWAPKNQLSPKYQPQGIITRTGQKFSLSLSTNQGLAFGEYISNQLDTLYEAFEKTQNERNDKL